MAGEQAYVFQLRKRDQPGTQSVINVMIIVGNLISQVAKLRLKRGLRAVDKTLAQHAKQTRLLDRTVLDDTLAGFKAQVKPVKRRVTLFELIDDTQALQVVFEAAVIAHAFVKRILPGVTERRMAQIVRQ